MRKSNNFEENYLSIKVEKLFPGFLRIQNINFDLVASTPLLIMLLTKCRFLSTLGKVPKRMLLAPSLKMLFQLRYIIFSVFSYFKVSQRKSKANSTSPAGYHPQRRAAWWRHGTWFHAPHALCTYSCSLELRNNCRTFANLSKLHTHQEESLPVSFEKCSSSIIFPALA